MPDTLHTFVLFRRLAAAAASVGLLATAAALAGRHAWYLELFTHLKPQLALAFLCYAALELAARHRGRAAASLALSALNGLPFLALLLPAAAPSTGAAPDARLRILQANILTCNTNAPALLALVQQENPDVIVLQEPDLRWLGQLAALTNTHPVHAARPRDDNFGAAIYCRTNALSASILTLDDPERAPSTLARVAANGRTLTIVGTHALAPYNARMWDGRNRFTLDLARYLRGLEGPTVVTGDFNNTPWSAHLRAFLNASGLHDSARGRSPQPTWPAQAPAVARIPIDHCFHSSDVRVLRRRLGPPIGSDHLPLIIDIAF